MSRRISPDKPHTFMNDQMRAIDREVALRASAAVQRSGIRGLSAAHSRLMAELTGDGARPSVLAVRLGVTKAAVGQLVARLQEKGLVELVPDPRDRRATIVKPTRAALNAYRAARMAIIEIEAEWAGLLGPRRAKALADSLSLLADWTRSQPAAIRSRRRPGHS